MSKIKENFRPPPPDLQQLVLDHGGYDKIPAEAWAEFDKAMAEWKADLKAGVHYAKN